MKTYHFLGSLLLGILFSVQFSYAQTSTEQPAEKKRIRVMLYVDGSHKPTNVTLGRKERNLELRAFVYPDDNATKLFIPSLDLSLVRNGQKIVSESIVNGSSISKVFQQAKNNDIYRIQATQIYRILEDGSLELYTKGSVTVDYWFYDAESLSSN